MKQEENIFSVKGRRRIASAGFVLLCVLLLLLPALLFRVGNKAQEMKNPQLETALVILPGAGSKEAQKNPGIRNVYDWIALQDPLLEWDWNSPYGYPALFSGGLSWTGYPQALFSPVSELLGPEPVPVPLPAYAEEKMPAPAAFPDSEVLQLPRPLPEITPLETAPRMVAIALWRHGDGTPLTNPPVLDGEEWKRAIQSQPSVSADYICTRLEVFRSGRGIRVVVRRSCGNIALDQLARQALLVRTWGGDLRPEESQDSGGDFSLPVEVLWNVRACAQNMNREAER